MTSSFLALEGLAGTGKSTIAASLAHRISSRLVRSVNPPFKAWSDTADSELSHRTRYYFYLAALADASQMIERALAAGERVLCDRYLATTQVRYAALGVDVLRDAALKIRRPDRTILITCDESERLRRVRERGPTANDMLELDPTFARAMSDGFQRYADASFDTTDKRPDEVVDAVAAWLEGTVAER